MAYRSSSSVVGSAFSIVGTAPAGVQAHDRIYAFITYDWYALGITPPAGWRRVAFNGSPPTITDSSGLHVFEVLDATGSESYTFTPDTVIGGDWVIQCVAFSGRHNSYPAIIKSTLRWTLDTTPISVSLAGLIANNNDDLICALNFDKANLNETWSFSTATGFTTRETFVTSVDAVVATLQTKDNVSSGATGSCAITATGSTGARAYHTGFVIAIPASTFTPPTTATTLGLGGKFSSWATRSIKNTAKLLTRAIQWGDADSSEKTIWDSWYLGDSGGVNASLNVTEAADTVAGAATVDIAATLSKTEAADTTTTAVVVAIAATASITEASDTLSSSVTTLATITATASITEANDTVSSGLTAAIVATASITETADTVSSGLTNAIVATLSKTETADTVSGTATNAIAATASITEASDTVSSGLTNTIVATLSVTEASDTLSSSVTVGTPTINADANITEASDTLSSNVTHPVTVTLSATELSDILASTIVVNISASTSITEAPDTLIAGLNFGTNQEGVGMATAITIINLALKDAGVIGEAQTPSSETIDDALQCLNDMFALWGVTDLNVFAQQLVSFPCTGAENYTIGTSGNIDTFRPSKIHFAYWRLNATDYKIDTTPTFEEYSLIPQKTIAGQPEIICYVPNYPLGEIHVHPQPSTGSIYLGVDVALPISNTLTSVINIAPQYVMAARFNLAVILSATFATQLRPDIAKLAATSLRIVQRGNTIQNTLGNTVPVKDNTRSRIFTG